MIPMRQTKFLLNHFRVQSECKGEATRKKERGLQDTDIATLLQTPCFLTQGAQRTGKLGAPDTKKAVHPHPRVGCFCSIDHSIQLYEERG